LTGSIQYDYDAETMDAINFHCMRHLRHAKALAAAIPQAKLTIISGGHNDWADHGKVKIRNP
jgi:hypothetical protein